MEPLIWLTTESGLNSATIRTYSTKELFTLYATWCKKNNKKAVSSYKFSYAFTKAGFTRASIRSGDGKVIKCWAKRIYTKVCPDCIYCNTCKNTGIVEDLESKEADRLLKLEQARWEKEKSKKLLEGF